MKKAVIIIILLAILILGLTFTFLDKSKKKARPLLSMAISFESDEDETNKNKNINETQEYKSLKEKCESRGGGIVANEKEDKLECYKIAGDSGFSGGGGGGGISSADSGNSESSIGSAKSCKNDFDCEYDCDFSASIPNCKLIKTDKDLGKGTYTYEYECQGNVEGKCSSLPLDKEFVLSGNLLTETGYKGFPGEKEEFSPA